MAQANAPGTSRLAQAVVTTNVAELKGLNTYDGYTLKAEDLVLLTGQTTQEENGTWVAATGAWTRPEDAPTGATIHARVVQVVNGTLYGGSQWLLNTTTAVVVGTNVQEWIQLRPGSTVTTTAAQTISKKRITRRVVAVTAEATPVINTDECDVVSITAIAEAITSMTTHLTGTPNAGDGLIIQFTDNGTARAITWGTKFEASTIALPTTTVISTLLNVGFIWNTVTSKWRCVGTA